MHLRHVVITSVNRDELPDGGAAVWADTIREIRRQSPGTNVEVLIPDFCGNWDALQLVLDEKPEILNHNLETVPRLYRTVRPQAKYHRSLKLLQIAKEQGFTTKTGIMLGLGEEAHEIEAVIDDLVGISCDILTIGQYLQPTPSTCPCTAGCIPTSSPRGRSAARSAACATSNPARWSAAAITRRNRCGTFSRRNLRKPHCPGPVLGRVAGSFCRNSIAMICACRARFIDSPRIRAASCGAWNPIEFSAATKSSRHCALRCSSRAWSSCSSLAPAARQPLIASIISTIAFPASCIRLKLRSWISATRDLISASG